MTPCCAAAALGGCPCGYFTCDNACNDVVRFCDTDPDCACSEEVTSLEDLIAESQHCGNSERMENSIAGRLNGCVVGPTASNECPYDYFALFEFFGTTSLSLICCFIVVCCRCCYDPA